LKISKNEATALRDLAIEATYCKLINKGKKLVLFKIMNLLEEAFKQIEEIKGMDIVMFWGGTGSGKSVSINYFLGHKLVKDNHYGRPYLKLKNESL
jgi:type II secretory ATPase GspE/PulE/Tfp pilus assembly ATPase PilB-like protein